MRKVSLGTSGRLRSACKASTGPGRGARLSASSRGAVVGDAEAGVALGRASAARGAGRSKGPADGSVGVAGRDSRGSRVSRGGRRVEVLSGVSSTGRSPLSICARAAAMSSGSEPDSAANSDRIARSCA